MGDGSECGGHGKQCLVREEAVGRQAGKQGLYRLGGCISYRIESSRYRRNGCFTMPGRVLGGMR